jgi:hypothetical protein
LQFNERKQRQKVRQFDVFQINNQKRVKRGIMKKFYVTKSDKSRVNFIRKSIEEINPSNIYILCEKDRAKVYEGIEALILPLKDLNKTENWIEFTKTVNENSLLVIDNVLKCVYFGDGKKDYLKNISQGLKNVIVTDIVPFYTEPHEIFYPFYLLGKNILGYGSYNTFKGNHFEEKNNGGVDLAHSFSVLKDKIKDYYIQDYDCFFKKRQFVEWQMTEQDLQKYITRKSKETSEFTNPIKLYNACSEQINLIETKYEALNKATKDLKNACIVINALGIYPKMIGKYIENKSVKFLSIHSQPSDFEKFETIVLAEMPIVKPHSWLYIEASLKYSQDIIQLKLINNKLESYFHDKIFNNELRAQFDSSFYSTNL